jgi:putative addiction module component (TIGR02574 family)
MPLNFQELGIDRLSAEDRVNLAESIWESVARDLEKTPPTEVQQRELECRLRDSVRRPDAVTAWETIKARALAKSAA